MRRKIREILEKTIGRKIDFDIFIPEKEEFGHYATNAALRLAQKRGRNLLEVAGEIVSRLEKTAPRRFFDKIEIAGPGFINFWLAPEILREELKKISKLKGKYDLSDSWSKKKVMVEFTDPNPFKEFHIGHLYSNIVGEALSRILEANGANVKRANYQGDVGLHVAKAVWGMKEGMRQKKISLKELGRKSLDYRIEFMGLAYVKGNRSYEEDVMAKLEITELNKKIFASDPEIEDLYTKGRRWSLDYFERVYKRLGTRFDFYYFERDVGKVGLRIVEENIKKGIFEESEGAIVFPGERYGLHRRVFINSEGLPTYEAKELGLEITKYRDFPADIYIVVTGSEIIDYFKVLLAALRRINPRLEKKIKHIAHGMVRLEQGKMSSRTGEVIRAENLLEETKRRVLKITDSAIRENKGIAEIVALGAIKYSFLKTAVGQDIIFDFEKSLSLKGDSGPYLQYTYARLRSILRKASAPKKADLDSLKQEEFPLLRKIIEFPDIVRQSAESFSPSDLAKYLYELADSANHYYETTPILSARGGSAESRATRLLLVETVALILKGGLNLLGIKVLERM